MRPIRIPCVAWLGICLFGGTLFGMPAPTTGAGVERWGLFEIALHGPAVGNPYADVRLGAEFEDRAGHHVAVDGFYDGAGTFRIRFMPEWEGVWKYRTVSTVAALDGRTGTVRVGPPGPGDHGPVRVAHTYHFAYADGTPYWPVGTTCYSWTPRPEAQEDLTLRTLAAAPFNKLRMCILPQDHDLSGLPPPRFPFAGHPPRAWDFERFNPAYFRHLELRIGQLRDLGIECDLILFHPYDRMWGFDELGLANDERYVRYVVARLAAYRNVWWSLANEYGAIPGLTGEDWNRLFQLVQRSDPYDHLRSIHNQNRFYDDALPWVTHASIQYWPAVLSPQSAAILRAAYGKPVIYDEVQYEGDYSQRWAELTGRELIDRIWAGLIGGTYVGHGEYFRSPDGSAWVAEGGVLHGSSPPRIAFMRRVLDDAPPEGIGLIDPWGGEPIGGVAGRYYLVYLGHSAPTAWVFRLPARGIREGDCFRVDVIDTWNMTIAPVPSEFTAQRANPYCFVDRSGRMIPLPGRPGMVVRVRRVGAGPVPAVPPTTP